ncbi:transposase [Escherichia coli]|nr:transposase [Escherichia coli]
MPVDFLTTEQTESYGRFTGTVAKLAMRQPFVGTVANSRW